ncbi:MAG: hypothetical protein ACREHG_01745, partial [Candidatus Saccharimonadales bacterium]
IGGGVIAGKALPEVPGATKASAEALSNAIPEDGVLAGTGRAVGKAARATSGINRISPWMMSYALPEEARLPFVTALYSVRAIREWLANKFPDVDGELADAKAKAIAKAETKAQAAQAKANTKAASLAKSVKFSNVSNAQDLIAQAAQAKADALSARLSQSVKFTDAMNRARADLAAQSAQAKADAVAATLSKSVHFTPKISSQVRISPDISVNGASKAMGTSPGLHPDTEAALTEAAQNGSLKDLPAVHKSQLVKAVKAGDDEGVQSIVGTHTAVDNVMRAVQDKVHTLATYAASHDINPADITTREGRDAFGNAAYKWAKAKGMNVPKTPYRGASDATWELLSGGAD